MLRRLLSLVFRLIFVVIFLFALSVAWILCDGLSDEGKNAEAAYVPGAAETEAGGPDATIQARLDRAGELYKANQVSFIIVSSMAPLGAHDTTTAMGKYLEQNDIPHSAIIEDYRDGKLDDAVQNLAAIMKHRGMASVMIVTQYYDITRIKLTFWHGGIGMVEQAHVGKLDKSDAVTICQEVLAIYRYLARTYLIPAAEKGLKEAKEKTEDEAGKVKKSVNNGLDSMSK